MEKTLQYKTARIISNIFVPPTNIFLLFVFLAIRENGSIQSQQIFYSGLFLGLVFPIIFFVVLQKFGKIANVDATIKEQRTAPYLFGILLCAIGYFWLKAVLDSAIPSSIWLVYGINTVIILLINKFWKISAHALGVASPAAAVYWIIGAPGIFLIIPIIIIGWARLELKVHTKAQVFAGAIFGILSTVILLSMFN